MFRQYQTTEADKAAANHWQDLAYDIGQLTKAVHGHKASFTSGTVAELTCWRNQLRRELVKRRKEDQAEAAQAEHLAAGREAMGEFYRDLAVDLATTTARELAMNNYVPGMD